MADTAATTSLLGYQPIYVMNSGKRIYPLRLRIKGFVNFSPLLRNCSERLIVPLIQGKAMELTQEKERMPTEFRYGGDISLDSRLTQWPPANKADNPALRNPLLRQERMGCGWLGVIFEWEGVLVEDDPDLEEQAWVVLSQEEGKSDPPGFVRRRIHGMKNEQAISEVLCWSRDPNELKRMAFRKEEIYLSLQGGVYRSCTGSKEFVNALMHHKVPMALVSTRPRKSIETAIGAIGAEGVFSVIVAAEDVHRGEPDPEMFIYAAELLKFIPERCIVFGNSNRTVEAAHNARMKCVAVAGKHPVYELGAADVVVRRLDELSVIDLKNLVDVESGELELEMEIER